MNTKVAQLEGLLFVAGKPLTLTRLAKELNATPDEIRSALDQVTEHLNHEGSGIRLFVTQREASLMTAPETAEFVRAYLKKDLTGELTRPSVETLAIIAYRGPITKPEIEQIRGVNCSLILRNLMIRGLVDEVESPEGSTYTVSMPFLRHLGVTSMDALPDFAVLSDPSLTESSAPST